MKLNLLDAKGESRLGEKTRETKLKEDGKMSVLENLNHEIIEEYKGGNTERRVFLQTTKAALLNKQKELKDAYNDEAEVKVLKSELKQREEALEQFKQGGRQDLVDKMNFEIGELKKMLPKEMSDDQIEKIVQEIVGANPDYNFGQIMKETMNRLAGQADGKKVSEIVQKIMR